MLVRGESFFGNLISMVKFEEFAEEGRVALVSKCLFTPLSTDTTNAVASKPTLVAVKIRFIYVTGNTDSLMFYMYKVITRGKAYSAEINTHVHVCGMNMVYH